MIACRLILCAQGIVRDAETNAISVYNILEGIRPQGFPILIQQFHVLLFLEKEKSDPAKVDIELRLRIGDVDLGPPLPVKVDFQNKVKNRTIVKVEGLVLPNSGEFTVSAYHRTRKLSSYRLDIEPKAPVVK